VCRPKHVEQLRNIGIINSTTRLHLVASFYEFFINWYLLLFLYLCCLTTLQLWGGGVRWKNVCVAMVEWYWQGKVEVLGKRRVPLPFCPPHISHGLVWQGSETSVFRSMRSIRMNHDTVCALPHCPVCSSGAIVLGKHTAYVFRPEECELLAVRWKCSQSASHILLVLFVNKEYFTLKLE